jgi:hypothetical protein
LSHGRPRTTPLLGRSGKEGIVHEAIVLVFPETLMLLLWSCLLEYQGVNGDEAWQLTSSKVSE